MSQPWLGGLHFLTFLCLAIFLFDCLYIYLVSRVRVTARAPEEASSLAVA